MKEKKDQRVELRLTAAEKERIREEAAKRDMSISEFIRFACQIYIYQKENDK